MSSITESLRFVKENVKEAAYNVKEAAYEVCRSAKILSFIALSSGAMYVVRNMGLLSEGKCAFINDESCSDFGPASLAVVDGVFLSGILCGANLAFLSVRSVLEALKQMK